MYVFNKEVAATPCEPGVTRKILGMGGSEMMVEVTFRAGAKGAPHKHPHEQVSYIAKGSFEFQLGEERRVLRRGDSVYIPADTLHGTVALEDSVIVDVFTPIREDFLKK